MHCASLHPLQLQLFWLLACSVVCIIKYFLGGLLLENDLSLAASYRVGLNPLNFNFVFLLRSKFLSLEHKISTYLLTRVWNFL